MFVCKRNLSIINSPAGSGRDSLSQARIPRALRRAFTLIELLVVIAIIGILASMLLPSFSRAKGQGQRIYCLNNLGQLGKSMQMYVDDYKEYYCPRGTSAQYPDIWPGLLRGFFNNLRVLRCPSDGPKDPISQSGPDPADSFPRSYIVNGWNDAIDPDNSTKAWNLAGAKIREKDVKYKSDTILFGEKRSEAADFWMDFWEFSTTSGGITVQGNDYGQVNQGMHDGSKYSNYALTDGHAAPFKAWKAVGPLFNRWGVTDVARTNLAFTPL